MKKLKETLQDIAFLLIGIPIMMIASIMEKERKNGPKAQATSIK